MLRFAVVLRLVLALLASAVASAGPTGAHVGRGDLRVAGPEGRTLLQSGPRESVPESLPAGDWAGIRAAYEAGRHAAFAVEGGWRARNPGQQWATVFDGRGFTVEPDAGGWSWGLELVSHGAGGEERAVAEPRAAAAEGSRVSYAWDADLTEWYVNDRRGLEHGYTVGARPGEGDGPLTLLLSVRGGLAPVVSEDGRDVRFVDGGGGAALVYDGLTVLDADGRALAARWEVAAGGLRLAVDERDARYPLTIDPIAQQAYLKQSNTTPSDNFGASVSVSGDTVVVGAPGENSSATGVDGDPFAQTLVSAGAAYVFVRRGGVWSQQAYLKASNTESGDLFGEAVAISGDTIVVGAKDEDSGSGDPSDNTQKSAGAVYVFSRDGSTWSPQAYLKSPNPELDDRFGFSVAVSADTIVVGVPLEDGGATGGSVFVFARSGATWSQQGLLKATQGALGDNFGWSVAVSGSTVVVGARGEDSAATGVNGDETDDSASGAGAAFVFVRSGTTWSQQAYLKASNTQAADAFGASVAVSGETIVVGADFEDGSATGVNGLQSDDSAGNSGAAYVFVRNGTTWSQQAYLKASNTDANDRFGATVAVSGDTVAVGAPLERSAATGVNGDESDNSAVSAGAAYVFRRTAASWSQQAYLKASNTNGFDSFGSSVAASGDVVLIGAKFEQSAATGVNGNQGDNSAVNAGAAYVLDLDNDPGTSSYGTGTPGCAGEHTLDVSHAPMIGSPNFKITCDNAPPSSLGLCLITDAQEVGGSDPFGVGVLLHVDLLTATEILAFDIESDASGYAETVDTSIPNRVELIGKTYYAQALWSWAGVCSLPPHDLSTSKGLAITILVP